MRPNSSWARRMSGEWLATLTVRRTALRAPTVLLISRANTRAGMTPERTICPGAFWFATAISPCSRRRVDDLVDLLVRETDDGSHAALDAALLHDPPALADEAEAHRRSRSHRRRRPRRTGRPSGRRGRCGTISIRPPAASSRIASRKAKLVARIAGWALTVRSSSSAGPSRIIRDSGMPSAASARSIGIGRGG